jgi:hypothetical protein
LRLLAAGGAVVVAVGIAAPSASADLLASYKFNNTGASNVPDDSGNGHTGTFFGSAGYNTTDTAPGVGGAGSLSVTAGGNTAHGVDLITNALTNFNAMSTNNAATVVFWENVSARMQTQFNFRTGTDDRQFMAHVPWVDGTVYFDTGGCCNADTRLAGAGGDVAGWHHWAFVKNGSNKIVYKDGNVLLSQTDNTATAPIGAINQATIGSFNLTDVNTVNGLMDEFAVFSHALTEPEVEVIMTQGVPVPEPAGLGLFAVAGAFALRRRRARRLR